LRRAAPRASWGRRHKPEGSRRERRPQKLLDTGLHCVPRAMRLALTAAQPLMASTPTEPDSRRSSRAGSARSFAIRLAGLASGTVAHDHRRARAGAGGPAPAAAVSSTSGPRPATGARARGRPRARP
jgi:hypothetical protein